jgi:hypothetical protein
LGFLEPLGSLGQTSGQALDLFERVTHVQVLVSHQTTDVFHRVLYLRESLQEEVCRLEELEDAHRTTSVPCALVVGKLWFFLLK